MAIKETIESAVGDLVSAFLYYDRKTDEELPRGAIEQAISDGVVTKAQIVKWFKEALDEGIHGPEGIA